MKKLNSSITQIADKRDALILADILGGVYKTLRSVSLVSAGLVIKAAAGVLVKTGAVWYGTPKNKLVTIASGVDMPALSGTVVSGNYNVFVFTIDSAGVAASYMGVGSSALAGVSFPTINDDLAVIGFVIIHPTGTGNFVGGTTALDDATVVPNVAYINSVGATAFNASI